MAIAAIRTRRMWRGNNLGRIRAVIRTGTMMLNANAALVARGGKVMLSAADATALGTIVSNLKTTARAREQIGQ